MSTSISIDGVNLPRSLSDSRGWRNYDSKSAARWIFYSIHRLYEETKRHFVPFLALSPTGC